MKLWLIKPAEGSAVAFIPDDSFRKAFGPAPTTVAKRKVIREFGYTAVPLQSGKPNAKNVESGRQILPDMLVWSWLLIFSTRAIRALTAAGCAGGEFWPCRFDTNPDDEFFFFLPEKHYDIIDFEKSKFRMVLPLDPPVPILIESLVALPLVEELPPCFHAEYPGRDIAFPDMFVRDDFKRKWEENGFTGARFVEI